MLLQTFSVNNTVIYILSNAKILLLERVLRYLSSMSFMANVGPNEFQANKTTYVLANPMADAGIYHAYILPSTISSEPKLTRAIIDSTPAAHRSKHFLHFSQKQNTKISQVTTIPLSKKVLAPNSLLLSGYLRIRSSLMPCIKS